MAYIDGFTYDIFISYAHLDNDKLSGQTKGWIEQFYTDLNILLSRRIGKPEAVKIWWDNKKLDGSKLFDTSIADGINHSAIMLCLTSNSYLGSEYCKKELDLFYDKVHKEPQGIMVGDRSRIINVLLNNIPFQQWPKELSGTTGFPFHDSKDKEDMGDPLEISDPQFKSSLQNLRDAIVKIVTEFPKKVPVTPAEKKIEAESSKNEFTIYFGDVSDGMRTTKKRTIAELEKKGYRVISDVPPPYEAAAHEKKIIEKLADSDLSIHLFDQYPGRDIEEDTICYPQKQAEIGLQYAKSQYIWVPAELDIETIEEERYKQFLSDLEKGNQSDKKCEYVRGMKSTISQEIIDLVEQIKLAKKPQKSEDKISVLLDTHYNDQMYAFDLSKSLLENEIQPFINPQEDDPRKNINMLGERISQVRKLVFFYGKVSRDWVLERMSAALQLIVTNNYPVEEFFILMVPPHKEPDDIVLKQRFLKVNIVDNSDHAQFDSDTFQQFLKNLKAAV
ncbi:MAG: toll/interleukin-1 receptor domain-containing protein [Chitinophagaceae bacterium]